METARHTLVCITNQIHFTRAARCDKRRILRFIQICSSTTTPDKELKSYIYIHTQTFKCYIYNLQSCNSSDALLLFYMLIENKYSWTGQIAVNNCVGRQWAEIHACLSCNYPYCWDKSYVITFLSTPYTSLLSALEYRIAPL